MFLGCTWGHFTHFRETCDQVKPCLIEMKCRLMWSIRTHIPYKPKKLHFNLNVSLDIKGKGFEEQV